VPIDKTTLWTVIVVLAIGTYLIRFSFLGLLGNRALPGWMLRALRYTPMAVLPGLVAPAVLWPAATGGETDPARLIAAMVTILVGILSRNLLIAIISGGAALYAVPWLMTP
jgi:branched-subunit amino acid transport protein